MPAAVLRLVKANSVAVAADYGVVSGVIFYVGVGAAVGTIFLIMLVALACCFRRRKMTGNSI